MAVMKIRLGYTYGGYPEISLIGDDPCGCDGEGVSVYASPLFGLTSKSMYRCERSKQTPQNGDRVLNT